MDLNLSVILFFFFPPDLLNKRIKNEGSRKCIGKGGREEERKEEEDGKEIDVK